jgi:hypothetical protein
MLEKNYRNIDKNATYFCLMQPIETFMGLISFTSSDTPWEWMECYIDEERYRVDDNYKVTLRALNGCAYKHYYQDDFISLMKQGLIVKKISDKMHAEFVDFIEPIPGTIAYLHHQGSVLVEA